MGYAVMIVEDEAVLAKKVAKFLQQRGFEVSIAGSGRDALEQLPVFLPDAVILDFNLPGGLDGLEILKQVHAFDAGIRVIMVTGHGNVRLAVDAMKSGAYDYLSKPVVLSELKLLLDRAIGQDRTDGQLSYFHDRQAIKGGLEELIGESPSVTQLKGEIARLIEAAYRIRDGVPPAVLIIGETGSGKELVARALHFGGPRREQPFIELNVATLPAHLVESELFGYERGAFTDARGRKLGLVEAAGGGTLFLDEIGELDLAVQAKLLKLLEDRTVRRLGSVRDHVVDIQVVTATNKPLERMVAESRFREDLYYRLNTITIQVPPLRDRADDILLLADHFLKQFAHKYNRQPIVLAEDAARALLAYPWPGNVRQLRNVMEQAALHGGIEKIAAAQLPLPVLAKAEAAEHITGRLQDPVNTPPATLGEIEREVIERTLREVDGNVSKAARRLGITRDRLRYRIDKYGLETKG
jgi:two-component system response regulator AtoC